MPVIYIDTRQQAGKHAIKHGWFVSHGIDLVKKKLGEGDYQTDGSNITVDTKAHYDELAANVTRDHVRFSKECGRAANNGLRLVVLTEEDIEPWEWTNSRCRNCPVRVRYCCHPRQRGEACARYGTAKPTQGGSLSKTLKTMTEKYGVVFDYCDKSETGKRICKWLGVKYDRTIE